MMESWMKDPDELVRDVPTVALLEIHKHPIETGNPTEDSREDRLQAIVRNELIRRGVIQEKEE